MPDSLTACHSILGRMIGPDMEPVSVIQRVEEHRWHWRPAQPRVVLLAESHVYTMPKDLQRMLRPVPQLPLDLPRGFVRLVYCLGYGEDALLDTRIATSRNSGTPQLVKRLKMLGGRGMPRPYEVKYCANSDCDKRRNTRPVEGLERIATSKPSWLNF